MVKTVPRTGDVTPSLPGLVGAAVCGQALKNAGDLPDFGRVLAILALIVAMTLAADRLSAALRARLL